MRLLSLCNCVPEAAYTQRECWEILQRADRFHDLKQRSQTILEKVLLREDSIAKRHFELPEVEALFQRDPEYLNHAFEIAAPALAERALRRALDEAGVATSELDALFVCTCTGYLCPGVSSHLSERLNLAGDVFLQDLVGLGCGAAIPTLRAAAGYLALRPEATVAVVAVEVCSAAFYFDDDPGVLISLCLFGDGASASVWRANGPGWAADCFDTVHRPADREMLRFENRHGYLRNKLHRAVPNVAGEAVAELYHKLNGQRPTRILSHAGGRDVIEAVERATSSPPIHETREILREYGNMSSPSVLFALERYLESENADGAVWLTSFGAGFAAHSLRLRIL